MAAHGAYFPCVRITTSTIPVLHSALRTSEYQNDAHHMICVVRVAFSIGVEAQIGLVGLLNCAVRRAKTWCKPCGAFIFRAGRGGVVSCARAIAPSPIRGSSRRGPRGAHRALSNLCSRPGGCRREQPASDLGRSR